MSSDQNCLSSEAVLTICLTTNIMIPTWEERALVLAIFSTSVAKLYGSVLGAVDGDIVNEITARRRSLGLIA